MIRKLPRSCKLKDVFSVEGQLLEGSLEPGNVRADLRSGIDAADVHLAEPQQALGVLPRRNFGCKIRDVINQVIGNIGKEAGIKIAGLIRRA